MGSFVATAKRRLTNAVKRGSLAPLDTWVMALGEWRAQSGRKRVPPVEIAVQATLLAGREVDEHEVRKILTSPSFRKYVEWCGNDRLAAARFQMESQILKAVRLQGDAMDWVRAEKDYRATPALTQPYLERAWPKQSDQAPVQANIQINFTEKQREYDEMPTLTVETVPIEEPDASSA